MGLHFNLLRLLRVLVLIIGALTYFSVKADSDNLKFSLQRLTYVTGEKSVSVSLRNVSTHAYLIQANMQWLDERTGINILNKSERIPFTVTPPLHKLNGGEYYSWRIMFTGQTQNLPSDRESVFLVQLKAIPSTERQIEQSLQFTVTRSLLFKVYYRPVELKEITLEQVAENLSFQREKNALVVKNNSPIYATFDNLSINGHTFSEEVLFLSVPPFSEQRFYYDNLPSGSVSWAILDEYLLPTKQKVSLIK
ncbi:MULTISPECIES: molecular chaperone [Providencia]|uniref:fimbrial biogenesis chaperone n=1 Tax=Providencia TaxID=586 RepID=UPI001FFA0EC1|nr:MULTISPECIES: molecular chaperone [Providencia]MDK7746045.1 molecular chaperone [Providencia rettgeri]MDK7758491.1 molecular chaperone [Providencia rettgeri]